MKVALGSGWRFYGEEWVHVDGGDYDHVKNYDLFHLPFENESVDLIFASHLIAYFNPEEFEILLLEWRRVLKVGATIRLATPDFEAMSFLYQRKLISLRDILGPIYGHMLMNGQKIAHKTCWDFDSLEKVLKSLQFRNIRNYDWRRTSHANVDDHSQAYLHPRGDKVNGTLISLNVEAIK